jgi:hypothetical protein
LKPSGGLDLGKVNLRNKAQRPWACSMIFEDTAAFSKRWAPRPRHVWREVRHPAQPAGTNRHLAALLNGAKFENDGVLRGGCWARGPDSEPSLTERSFQLIAR